MENYSMQDKQDDKVDQESPNIIDVVVKDENTAFNIIVQFVHIAQKRGAFNLRESAKIWECISKFMKK